MTLLHESSHYARPLARGLGWFSVALGLTELLASRGLANFLGTRRRTGVIQSFGGRELVCGLGILFSREPDAGWLWARVAGDALDLVSLEEAMRARGTKRGDIAFAMTSVLGVTLLDVWCAIQLSKSARRSAGGSGGERGEEQESNGQHSTALHPAGHQPAGRKSETFESGVEG
ncbi:MAG: hypothetical protein WCF18_23465 [Chthoniobacteraceae bacterium]